MDARAFKIARLMPQAVVAGCLLASLTAEAATSDTAIGATAIVHNDVRGETASGRARLSAGETVVRDERVSTGVDSMTRIVLIDDTNVALGPSSRLTLDHFVFDPEAGARAVGIEAAKGVFRFFSGCAAHDAYDIKTPQASIAVRGTTYDVLAEAGRTRVTLRDGAVHVCMRTAPRCVDLVEPGQSVEVTDQSIAGPLPAADGVDFSRYCGGRGGALLCGRARFAELATKQPRHAGLSTPAARPPRQDVKRPARRRLAARPIWRAAPDDEIVWAPPPPRLAGPVFRYGAPWGPGRWGRGLPTHAGPRGAASLAGRARFLFR